MDPQMNPKIETAMLILGDPCRSKALQGPSKDQIDQFFSIDLRTTDKLKNTAWFEVNRTSGYREIIGTRVRRFSGRRSSGQLLSMT